MNPKSKKDNPVIAAIEKLILTFVTLEDNAYALVLALWAVATHMYPSFDSFPVLVITGYTPGCGKSRCLEVVKEFCSFPQSYSASRSVADVYHDMVDLDGMNPAFVAPSQFWDEGEPFRNENHPLRDFICLGYQNSPDNTFPVGGERYPRYSPKAICLIGDVFEALRTRSIAIVMRRRTPAEQAEARKTPFTYSRYTPLAHALRAQISDTVEFERANIEEMYQQTVGQLDFFADDRDADIWTTLFAVAKVLCPSRIEELTRIAADIAGMKSQERASFNSDAKMLAQAKEEAQKENYGALLVRDMLALAKGRDYIVASELPEALKAIPTSPWRVYKGKGIDSVAIGYLLGDLLKNTAKRIGASSKRGEKTRGTGAKEAKALVRVFMRADIEEAARHFGLLE